MTLLGRKKECHFLNEVFSSQKAEFIAIYGRRRVGKTYLINEFFQKKVFSLSSPEEKMLQNQPSSITLKPYFQTFFIKEVL